MNYLSAENISKSFGDQVLFEGITFGMAKGEKTAIIARNGTGKTTLLRILAGVESTDSGEFTFRNGIKVAFLEQAPDLDQSLTIDELILSANTAVLTVIKHYEKVLEEHAGSRQRKQLPIWSLPPLRWTDWMPGTMKGGYASCLTCFALQIQNSLLVSYREERRSGWPWHWFCLTNRIF